MRKLLGVLAAVASLTSVGALVPARAAGPAWAAAWGTSLHGSRDFGADPWARAATPLGTISDQTLRLVVRTWATGPTIRLRLSNRGGDRPVTFGHVSVARRLQGAALDAATVRAVRFGGRGTVTLAPGAEAVSDAVPLSVAPGTDLAVSLHVAGTTSLPAWHRFANMVSYLSPAGSGDATRDVTGATFASPTTSWFWLAGVDVAGGPRTAVVVALGDSITDGFPLVPDVQQAWPAALSERFAAAGRAVSVINAGIAGNRVVGPPCGQCGARALDRLDREVLAVPGVTAVVVFEGTNDLAAGVAPYDLVMGLTQLATRIRARGLRAIGATITPRGGSTGWTATLENRRAEVNRWIRTSGAFDAVVDFDVAVRDPISHEQLRHDFDGGDELHPNALGLAAMAAAVPLDVVTATRRG